MRFRASSHHGLTPLYFGPAGACQDLAWYVFCIWRIPDAHPVVARKLVGRPNPVPLATDTRLAHTSANSNFRVACISYLAYTQRIPGAYPSHADTRGAYPLFCATQGVCAGVSADLGFRSAPHKKHTCSKIKKKEREKLSPEAREKRIAPQSL